MIKNIKIIIIYAGILLILSACSSPEGKNTENIADNGIKGIEPPSGCDVVEEIDKFDKVSGNQSYNADTDSNTSFYILNGTDAGEVLYCFSGKNWLCYFDKSTGGYGIVCAKPDCEHSNDECNAFVNQTWGTQYYDGYLYTVTAIELKLLKISLDGSQREELGQLADIESANTLIWVIHRGYIYYCYTWDVGTEEDNYYLNNSNCIYRRALDKDSEPECILAFPLLSNIYECQFTATGSYVYMKVPTADDTTGRLYRYNTENDTLEWFKEWGDEISGVFVDDNKIFYSENNRSEKTTNIYEYDNETGEKNIFCKVNGLVDGIKYDNDFIYIPYEEEGEWKTGIWNWQGECIAGIPSFDELYSEGIYREWLGTDDKYIYLHCIVITNSNEENIYTSIMGKAYVTMEYIEKEDILDGEYEIKKWDEIAE